MDLLVFRVHLSSNKSWHLEGGKAAQTKPKGVLLCCSPPPTVFDADRWAQPCTQGILVGDEAEWAQLSRAKMIVRV
jgi:hypothetical protein